MLQIGSDYQEDIQYYDGAEEMYEGDDGDDFDESLGEAEGNEDQIRPPWHPEFPRPSKEILGRLLIRPEDIQREISRLFFISQNHAQKALYHFFEKYPSTHVIRLDGNCTPIQMFHVRFFVSDKFSLFKSELAPPPDNMPINYGQQWFLFWADKSNSPLRMYSLATFFI